MKTMNPFLYHIRNIFLGIILTFSVIFSANGQCGFDIRGGLTQMWIEVIPMPNMADSASIAMFLDTNLDNVGGATSGGTRFNLFNNATQEEMLGVRSIVCPDATCDFNVEFDYMSSMGFTVIQTNPELSDALINQLINQFGADEFTNQFSGGHTYIGWDYIFTPEQEMEAETIICPAAAPIPTMGEWGFLVLGLLIAVVAIIAIRQRKVIFAFFF